MSSVSRKTSDDSVVAPGVTLTNSLIIDVVADEEVGGDRGGDPPDDDPRPSPRFTPPRWACLSRSTSGRSSPGTEWTVTSLPGVSGLRAGPTPSLSCGDLYFFAASARALRMTGGLRGSWRIGQDETGLVSERQLRVGLVTEPEGIDDPYNRGAYLGLERAVRELGVRGRVLTPAPKEGFVPSPLTSRAAEVRPRHRERESPRPARSTASPRAFPKRGSRSSTAPIPIGRIAPRTSWTSRSAQSKPVIWPVTWLRSC